MLFENHYMNIKKIDLFFNPDVKNKTYFCRNCSNAFYSEIKYNDHIKFCQTNKPMILLPSKDKYLKFKNIENIENRIQHNFIAFADIESYMQYENKNIYKHKHLMSGYYLHCLDEKYSKKVQLFDKLDDFRDNLIFELDYIENINENVLNYETDMSTFNQKEFDNVKICKYCDHDFDESYYGRKITLMEKFDKYKLKRIIDDFDNNNINEETQHNLKQYYNSLHKDGEVDIIYKQNNNIGRYYSSSHLNLFQWSLTRSKEEAKTNCDMISNKDIDGKIRWEVEYPEYDNQYIPFLDTEILIKDNGEISSRYYRKPRNKGITLNYRSHHQM